MTAKQAVFDLLKQQKQIDQAGKLVDMETVRREWLEALGALMNTLHSWLKDAVDQQLLRIETTVESLKEERLGPVYTAPALKVITPTDVVVHIRPRARFVVGAHGRVDLECPPKKAMLVRKQPNRWQFADLTSGSAGRIRELTEESFWEVLMDLIS
jgi:hypothetical protein